MGKQVVIAVVASVSLFAGPQPGLAQPIPTEKTFPALPLRLAHPQGRPLSAAEISALISDHTVAVDEQYEPAPGVKITVFFWGGCPPYETFFANGDWQMGMCQRMYRVYEGRWMIEPFSGGERLCVEAYDYPKACRFVWQGSSTDQIVMELPMPADGDNPRRNFQNDTFSPYRVKPPEGHMRHLELTPEVRESQLRLSLPPIPMK